MSIEEYIDENLKKQLIKQMDHQISRLPEKVRDRIGEYIVSTQGKMLRPLLIVISAALLGASEEELATAYNSAVSIELLHNFTLIHDDLLDGAPLRRGQDAYHIRHGTELAIHDGDILHTYALSFVESQESLGLILKISNMVGRGNGIELEDRLDQNFNFNKEHVINILRLKTAVVFYGCVALAGIATKKQHLTDPLEDIITDAGIAFQIQDDILDIVGDSVNFGKLEFWDIQESKRNLFLYFALKSDSNEKLKTIYNKPVGEKTEEEVRFVVDLFRKHASKVIDVKNQFYNECIARLEKKMEDIESSPIPEGENLMKLYEFLVSLIYFICNRKK